MPIHLACSMQLVKPMLREYDNACFIAVHAALSSSSSMTASSSLLLDKSLLTTTRDIKICN